MPEEAYALLQAKLRDGIKLANKRPYFIGFLDEAEATFCEDFLRKERCDYLFWGGFDDAERCVLGIFPDYLSPESSLFPLCAITFTFRDEDKLSHRDFLGSFMGLGVERSVIGDILVENGRCVAFVRSEMQEYFLQNIRKIGRTGVKISLGAQPPLPSNHEFEDISGVIASQRIDCLVALLCRTGREKAASLITSGSVMLNHREILSVSEHVNEGDKLSVRKYGKFVIDRLGPLTSKGRLSVKCRKFK